MESVRLISHPLVQHKLSLLRDKSTQVIYFRQLLREISMLMAYEVTKDLPVTVRRIETPLQNMEAPFIAGRKLCLVSILRAGNGFLDGFLEVIPAARVGFVGVERDHDTHKPRQYYLKVPPQIEDRQVIVLDPMLATGGSAIAALDLLKQKNVSKLKFLSLVSAPEGIAALQNAHPDVTIYTAAIDEKLNENAYIVPGLGDAGDRIYGTQ
jgi:uracil phosphoribosyltransferase